jgi:hypothetical protein
MPGIARHIVRLAGLALCLAPVTAAAQTGTRNFRNEPNAPIVVTGERVTREQARERAVTFVRQVGVARGETPVARWTDRVCPRVLGIALAYSSIVEARMREIAAAAGMRVAPAGCQPNIVVSFVGDAAGLVRDVARRSPRRLAQVSPELRDGLLNGDAPVRWWYVTETRSREQMRNAAQSIGTTGSAGAGPGGGGGSGGSESNADSALGLLEVEGMSQFSSSVISTQAARAIIDAQVVIDLDRAEGQSLQAVAAYAAFVAFSEVRPSQPPPTGSILGLFATGSGASGLTDWDMAFLRSLYNISLDRQARRHRGLLVRDMVGFQTRE